MLDREARYRSPAFPFTDPLVLVIIDEADMRLSAASPYHLEAKAIVEQLTRRSLKQGMQVLSTAAARDADPNRLPRRRSRTPCERRSEKMGRCEDK
ncbi:hypothetical protein [Streptomyces sp. NPDC002553]|uniref:hypothetical protein n=1 Tax=Streptomyces sp. NPDC002553 TaxID=3154417 RepID=UPI003322BBE5